MRAALLVRFYWSGVLGVSGTQPSGLLRGSVLPLGTSGAFGVSESGTFGLSNFVPSGLGTFISVLVTDGGPSARPGDAVNKNMLEMPAPISFIVIINLLENTR